ncbi:MAG TPA: HNH endonuclease signature motif containing protein [Stellaceae bacterium]|nr:HNH endonuclease signature motif containing protein [Stellaceae bacterium]
MIAAYALAANATADPPTAMLTPDPVLTPGVVASTDADAICGHAGGGSYSRAHRFTTPEMKAQVFAEYGMAVPVGPERRRWEIDHRVPLALGGADDLRNLWPQYRGGLWGYPAKDRFEAYAAREVCDGRVPLATAQGWFLAPDWRVGYCAVFRDENCPAR